MDGMEEIVQEFLIESHENLDQLDRDLIELETSPSSRDLLARIFRTIHTIKGTSGFLAFHNLEKVAHVGENLLVRLRDGHMTMTQETTDVLLLMADTIRDLLGVIEESAVDTGIPIDNVVATITATYEEPEPDAPTNAADSADAATAEPTDHAAGDASASNDSQSDAAPADDAKAPASDSAVSDATVPADAQVPTQAAPAEAAPASPVPATNAAPADAATSGGGAHPHDGEKEGGVHKRSAAEAVVRVDVDLLDELMLLVGELVLTRNQIVQYSAQQTDQTLLQASQRLNLIASELQEGVMKTRMQPMEALWSKFPRVVRDLGIACGKQVRLNQIGKETELDRTLLEAVKDPLTHLIRNAVDHGLELPEERVASGKGECGVVTLVAYHEGGQVVVEIHDDGRGIDGEKVAAKAIEKGLKTQAQLDSMSPADLAHLIFLPGFSTAEVVTNVSGRGVGMDVVKSNIEGIGGTIEIESQRGKGSIFRLRIPLTLAIVPALTVECSQDIYAIPQVNLVELVALDSSNSEQVVEDVGGVPVYRLRGKLLPLVYLSEVLGVEPHIEDGAETIAVLNAEGRRFGLVLDRVISTEEIVVKPLSKPLKNINAYSGATILGNGRVALILDVPALARDVLNPDGLETEQSLADDQFGLIGTGAAVSSQVLVVGIGDGRQIGIPLAMVTRLEEISAEEIESVGSREVLQHRGTLLPILRLDRHLGAYSESAQERLHLVVYSDHGRSIAIVVDAILDIVEENVAVASDIDDHGLLGSAVIRDKVVEMLDVRAAILAVDPIFFDRDPSEFQAEEDTHYEGHLA